MGAYVIGAIIGSVILILLAKFLYEWNKPMKGGKDLLETDFSQEEELFTNNCNPHDYQLDWQTDPTFRNTPGNVFHSLDETMKK